MARHALSLRGLGGFMAAPLLVTVAASALTPSLALAGQPDDDRPRDRLVHRAPSAEAPGFVDPGRGGPRPAPIEPPMGIAATWTWMDGGWGWQYEPDCVTGGITYHNTYAGYYGAIDGSGPLTNTVYYMHIGFSVGGGCAGGIAASLWGWLPRGTTMAVSAQYPVRCMWDKLDGQGFREITGSSYADCKANPQPDANGKIYFGTPQIPNFTMYEVWFPVKSTQRLIGSAGPNGGDRIQTEIMIGTANPMYSHPKMFVWVSDGTSNQPQISVSYPDDPVTDKTCVGAKTTGHVYNQYTSGSAYIDIARDGFAWEASAGPIALGNQYAAHSVFTGWNLASEQKYKWRVRYITNGTTYTGAEKSFTTDDCVAPAGNVSINNGAASTTSQNVTLGLTATDRTGVTQMRISNDGVNFSGWESYATSRAWSLTAGAGSKTVAVQFRDAAGNVSSTATDSISYQPAASDTTPPVAQAPGTAIVTPSVLGTSTAPVKVTWPAATDANGIARYELQQSVNGGAYSPLTLSSQTATSFTAGLAPGASNYRFRVRAFDPAGNDSGWQEGTAFTLSRVQENAAALVYTGTWTRAALTGASGGYVKYASASTTKVTFAFAGKGVALAMTKGSNRGKADVYLDGAKIATVDLYSAKTKTRQIVYASTYANGNHTLEVRVLGTRNAASSGKRVDLDAVIVTK